MDRTKEEVAELLRSLHFAPKIEAQQGGNLRITDRATGLVIQLRRIPAVRSGSSQGAIR